jgi:4'-phosphopantetheinyl transferase
MIHWALQANAGWAAAPPGATPFDVPHPAAALTAAERGRFEALHVPKRRAEWLLGRTAAKSVVAQALRGAIPGAWRPEVLEIASAPSGMPYARLAPEAEAVAGFQPGERLPVTVTISHTAGHALAAATWYRSQGTGAPVLGADLGVVEPRSPAFLETFLTDAEQRWVRDAPWWERDLRVNFVWCAKEAVLKALGVGLTVDTRGVECRTEQGSADRTSWPLAPADEGWSPFLATCDATLVPGGASIGGVWRRLPGFVGTLASWTPPPPGAP